MGLYNLYLKIYKGIELLFSSVSFWASDSIPKYIEIKYKLIYEDDFYIVEYYIKKLGSVVVFSKDKEVKSIWYRTPNPSLNYEEQYELLNLLEIDIKQIFFNEE